MRIVALLTVRNEERYLARCLEHLYQQKIETCLIDNGSTDHTLEIAEGFRSRGVFRIEHLPFAGEFELNVQLLSKERLSLEIEADWFIHQDADEIREAPKPYKNLRQGIEAIDARGYNAIDFDEFVFLPTADDEAYEGRDYVEAMRCYYYFEPASPDRLRINAWKKHANIDLHSFAGHRAVFPGISVALEPFIMRHYIVLSRAHAVEKYGSRIFSRRERALSWHGDRASFDAAEFRFPAKNRLKRLDHDERFDKSEPWKSHPIFVSPAGGGIPPAPAPDPAVDRVRAERQRRINALKQFKQEQSKYIPSLAPVSESVERPFWSVMVPVYNASEVQLKQALESVLAQDPGAQSMQIEVVDDGSTTFDCGDLVNKLANGRIEFHRNERTRGLPGNWNACLQRARGFWIHLLHQDDRVLPGFYERFHGACADQGLAAAFCRGAGCDDAGKILWVQELERESAGILANFSAREAAVNRIVSPSVVVRRSVYEEIGGFHEGLPYCADWDLYKRAAVYGPIWYEPQCLAHWRQHDGSASARLKSAGDDLVDRRKSIELSKSYLPTTIDNASAKSAFKSSLVWAAETLREALARDDFGAALAQAREIMRTIEQMTAGKGERDGGANLHGQEPPGLQAEVDALQAQVQAWIRAAEAIRAKYQQPRE